MRPRKLDPTVAPISTAVGVLGMLGMTAWSGVKIQCDPQPGETVVVSAASGGVGQCAGQIAKQLGARVVGIAGPAEKCAFAEDVLGFDACVSYRSESFPVDLAAACPDGCDVCASSPARRGPPPRSPRPGRSSAHPPRLKKMTRRPVCVRAVCATASP